MSSHYEVLNVSPGAEDFVIEAAYRALLKRYHPDVSQGDPKVAEDRAKAITEAYQVLRDPSSRARYDRDIASGQARRPPPPKAPPPPPQRPTPSPIFSTPERGPSGLVSWFFIGLAGLVATAALGSVAGWGSGAPAPPPKQVAAAEAPPQPAHEAPPIDATPVATDDAPAADPDPVPVPAPGAGPSFDCRRAATEVLRLICSNSDLSRADRALADRYQQALTDAESPATVRSDQRRWLAQRNLAPADFNSLMALYDERLSELASSSGTSEPIYE